jgi:hypothetical protein
VEALVMLVIPLVGLLLRPSLGKAQDVAPEPYARYRYAVKFVCGTAGETPLQVVKGTYASAVNVHNPSLYQSATFIKKVAVAFSEQRPGPISPWVKAYLEPDQAFEIDCPDIRKILATTATPVPPFIKGFGVILTPAPLDVTGVYTARPTDGQVSTMDIEVIGSRVLPSPTTSP